MAANPVPAPPASSGNALVTCGADLELQRWLWKHRSVHGTR